ncbi:MAG: aminotransferase class V-fold PLP-dependent enzyme [Candidatus Vidania fulgoroideorum]
MYFNNKINKYILEKTLNIIKKRNFTNIKEKIIKICKNKIKKIINCKKNELIFTSCCTESNNIAIENITKNLKIKKIYTFKTEHLSIIKKIKNLKKSNKIKIKYINKHKKGYYNTNNINKKIKKNSLIIISWINNETGVIQNIKKICNICKKKNIFIHVDATHAFGKVKINLKNINNITSMSFSCNKLSNLESMSVLYINKKVRKYFKQIMFGGKQEYGIRPGTIPIINIIIFGYQCMLIIKNFKKINNKLIKISKIFIKRIKKIKGIEINGNEKHLIDIFNISIKNSSRELIKEFLKDFNFTFQSICIPNSKKSYVLKNINIKDEKIYQSIRIKIEYNDKYKYIKKLINKIIKITNFIKKRNFNYV